MNVYDRAHALSRAISESPEYRALRQNMERINQDSAASSMLKDLQEQQLAIRKQKLSGVEVAPEAEEKLQKLAEIASLNPLVKEYLSSEYRFAVLMQDVQKIIGDALGDLAPASGEQDK